MRIGIPLLDDRVAPRCTFADSVLLVTVKRRRIVERTQVSMEGSTWADLARVLGDQAVDTMICGGISRPTRESIEGRGVHVIDNVVGPVDAVVDALQRGRLDSGFGLSESGLVQGNPPGGYGPSASGAEGGDGSRTTRRRPGVDCLACDDRQCLRGEPCPWLDPGISADGLEPLSGQAVILESARDVAFEEERALCRLAELVYFALGAGYERVGVAFCVELREPAEILTRVLRRFFDVLPVGCKVRSRAEASTFADSGPATGTGAVPCDPLTLAAVLNAWRAELNVVVGLCVGVDSVFSRASLAPVTTLFVKDRSLANNPIGAVYSHYHLQDI
jgi:uncharacterized metal-binding protein/predicted Fe-Mo cluster-binding NifX family protein